MICLLYRNGNLWVRGDDDMVEFGNPFRHVDIINEFGYQLDQERSFRYCFEDFRLENLTFKRWLGHTQPGSCSDDTETRIDENAVCFFDVP